MASQSLQYPHLKACKVVLTSSTATTRPPVRLPQSCIDAVAEDNMLPVPYDFKLEQEVISLKQERERDLSAVSASSREELQDAVLIKMRSVTNADDKVCIAILEEHDYDLKTSVEAFFESRN